MSGLGFVRLPARSLRVLRRFLDGFPHERSPSLFDHPRIIDESRGRGLSRETQLYNELVLWLRYYEALVARRPAHLDLMRRIRDDYDNLFGFVRTDGDLSPFFGLRDVDVFGGAVYQEDYIPRVDVFLQGLYDLSRYLAGKNGGRGADAYGFINVRPEEAQRLMSSVRNAAENLLRYELLDVRDFKNDDPLVLALNRLTYLCRLAYAMSKGWRDLREMCLDRANLLRRRLVLALYERPAFARVYARNALGQTVGHADVYTLLRRLEDDRALFVNALRWGDPDWGLDSDESEREEEELGEDGAEDEEDEEASKASVRKPVGGSILVSPSGGSSGRRRGGSVSWQDERERSRDGVPSSSSFDPWRSDAETVRSRSGGDDLPAPLRDDEEALRKPGRKASIAASPKVVKGRDDRALWLESGDGEDGAFVSDGQIVKLPQFGLARSGGGPEDSFLSSVSHLDDKYLKPTVFEGARTKDRSGRAAGGGKMSGGRHYVKPSQRLIASYKKRPERGDYYDDDYYWDDLGSPLVGSAADLRSRTDDYEDGDELERDLEGLRLESGHPPRRDRVSQDLEFGTPSSRSFADSPFVLRDSERGDTPPSDNSSGITVLTSDTAGGVTKRDSGPSSV